MNESDEGLRFEVDVFTGKGFLVFVLFFVRRKEKERDFVRRKEKEIERERGKGACVLAF